MLIRPSSIEYAGVSVLPLLCKYLKFVTATVKVGVTPEGIEKKFYIFLVLARFVYSV